MPTINQLPLLDDVSSGDQIPVYSPQSGDSRRLPVSALLSYFEQQYPSPTLTTNIYVPTTGFSIAVPTPATEQQWMLLTPAGTLATGTIVLPLNTTTPDGFEVLVTTTQIITTFTLSLNGAAAANGAPSTLAANGFFRVRYVQANNAWYRIS
jgi:hypothetical protein